MATSESPLIDALQLGEPRLHRSVTITPVFPRRRPRASYLTLDVATAKGLEVHEMDAHGSVPELRVRNPLAADVLLYDGEELIGAMQNRILNVSVLVAAGSETAIPVSCVEQGRWSRRGRFAPAPHAANPALRRRKAASLRAAPLARGAAQGEVWQAVADMAAHAGVDSPTGAHADTYAARSRPLEELAAAFPLEPGQAGALLALPSGALCLDYVSRPDAFARLYPKLLRGYAFDALAELGEAPAPRPAAEAFLCELLTAPPRRRPSAGRGEDLRLERTRALGSGLVLEGELLQLCGYRAA